MIWIDAVNELGTLAILELHVYRARQQVMALPSDWQNDIFQYLAGINQVIAERRTVLHSLHPDLPDFQTTEVTKINNVFS